MESNFREYNQEEVIKQLGVRIRKLRKQKGYTSFETFAYEKGFSRVLMGKIETGQDVRLSTLVRLVNALEISFEELFDDGFER